jgi:RNA polymerase sigma-70 factor (ECF subfamily)
VRADPGPYSDRTDEWLVERCRNASDEAAFGEIVRRYRGPVFRLVVSILGQAFAADAEDVAQDVMLRAHRGLGSFRGESKFGSWIYRIAFNHALNVKARARFRAPHSGDETLARMAAAEPPAPERLHHERRQRAVLECVRELPEVYQAALRLHYWLGASVSEIAGMLDTPENTVKSYLHRARRLRTRCLLSGDSMHEDELMDHLLRDAMATEPPQLSPGFDAAVMRRVHPRRLTPIGQVAMAAYILIAAATTAWWMRELPLTWIAAFVVVAVPAAAGARAYARHLSAT